MKREIITIDEDLCNGCGLCVPNCHEGALQIIDGKARLVSDLMCDGLGACIGHCPEGAITIEEREAEPYDEIEVMQQMNGKGTHAKEEQHKHNNHNNPEQNGHHGHSHAAEESAGGCGCAGSKTQTFTPIPASEPVSNRHLASALTHWPVQMHLINPRAGHFQGSHLLLAADCTAFSLGSFHPNFLHGKALAIACPKLDSNREVYIEKLKILIDESQIDMLTVMIMEVPCCSGLLQMAELALSQCSRQIPVKLIIISVDGQIKQEKWHKVA
ncbi:MAG: 4Fe-4S ferredoxin [Porphyromonadaceae bacterium]|nr:MAG: 4Fe-4S ferredoxin [Porphyromonadaceae bacterium]